MRDIYHAILTLLAALLALGLILGFCSFSTGSRVGLSILVSVSCGIVLWRQRVIALRRHNRVRNITDDSLPPEDFLGAVILTCGDCTGLFDLDASYRETRQGRYLQVEDALQLKDRVQQLCLLRPALVSQISVLLAIQPEHHCCADAFTQGLQSWKRGIVQCRFWLGEIPPVWTVTWVSPLQADLQEDSAWFLSTRQGSGIHDNEAAGHVSHLLQALWLGSLLQWQSKVVDIVLVEGTGELPGLKPCARGFCRTAVSGRAGNLWQQHIAEITALPPDTAITDNAVPLPELLLPGLPRCRGVSQNMMFWGAVGLLGGIFLGLAMLASWVNNQRLLQNVGDHLALYHHFNGEPPEPKFQAQQRLRADARLLDDWQRQGEPLRYRMGLYQGFHLLAPVEAAINAWAPPLPPKPAIQQRVERPTVVRLDAMSLFGSGQFALKPEASKVLIHSLMGIKARPGWLIVVSGHTDNTGTPALNQTLSLKRAVSVRDWIRDTGDVPESCFAVQGYGADRPVATNNTPEGRSLNRRVEIRLVPQVDACTTPAAQDASND